MNLSNSFHHIYTVSFLGACFMDPNKALFFHPITISCKNSLLTLLYTARFFYSFIVFLCTDVHVVHRTETTMSCALWRSYAILTDIENQVNWFTQGCPLNAILFHLENLVNWKEFSRCFTWKRSSHLFHYILSMTLKKHFMKPWKLYSILIFVLHLDRLSKNRFKKSMNHL